MKILILKAFVTAWNSDNRLVQDLTAEAVASTSKGCVWNQDIPRLLKDAGLSVDNLERHLGGLITLAETHRPRDDHTWM